MWLIDREKGTLTELTPHDYDILRGTETLKDCFWTKDAACEALLGHYEARKADANRAVARADIELGRLGERLRDWYGYSSKK